MRFRVLGPVEAYAGSAGERAPLAAAKVRSLLAVLLLHANQQVSRHQLMAAVWPANRPRSAEAVLRTYVSGLRQALGFSRSGHLPCLAVAPAGYRLDVAPADLDVLVFEELAAGGRRALGRGEPSHAAGLLRDALALWRGYPAQDASVDPDTEVMLARLVELRLSTEEAWADAELAQRHEAEVIPRLRALVCEHPLREQFWVQLMTALHRTGRRAEALAAFHELRRGLVGELGLEPGVQARELQARILGEPVPAPRAPAPALLTAPKGPLGGPPDLSTGMPGPRLLPTAIPGFTGREAELAYLDRSLARTAGSGRTAPALVVLSGLPGVGKTALAVHWAHTVAGRFPDGQLYADLQGFGPHGPPVSTEAVVRRFLEALDVPLERISGDPVAQADLYRSLLARRRVLAVLDNAGDAEQVRALLPTTPGSMTVVTSRDLLIGLLAGAGAEPLALDVLPPADARELLTIRLGPGRMAGDPEAAADIVTRCGGLPLALALVATRLAAHPGFTLAAIAAELNDGGGVLGSLDLADPSAPMRRNGRRLNSATQTGGPPCTGCSTTTCTPHTPPRWR